MAASKQPEVWFSRLGRVGLTARAVTYFLLAYLALDVAVSGAAPTKVNSQGALQEVSRQPAGAELLGVLAAGLFAYALWRFSTVVRGPGKGQRNSTLKRLAAVAAGVVYVLLGVRAVLLLSGHPAAHGSSSPRPWAAQVLRWPSGPLLIDVIGGMIIAAGIGLALWGCFHDPRKTLDTARMTHRAQRLVRLFSALGDLARGLLVTLIGAYLLGAGLVANAAKVKGVDAALLSLVSHTYGTWLLGAAAIGIACFGAYSLMEARYRQF